MSAAKQLPTYPFLNPSLTQTFQQLTVIGLGEGLVCSCLDTVIDPDFHPNETTIGHFTVMNLVAKPLIWKEAEGDHVVIESSI